jgi:hypothetical protein
MLIHLMQQITNWQVTNLPSSIDLVLFAQLFNENVFARFNTAMDNFIASGQIWAMLAGLILGYLIRGFTTYG